MTLCEYKYARAHSTLLFESDAFAKSKCFPITITLNIKRYSFEKEKKME